MLPGTGVLICHFTKPPNCAIRVSKNETRRHECNMCFAASLAVLRWALGRWQFWGWGESRLGPPPCTTSAVCEHPAAHRVLSLKDSASPFACSKLELGKHRAHPGWGSTKTTKCSSREALSSQKLETARWVLQAVQVFRYWRRLFS